MEYTGKKTFRVEHEPTEGEILVEIDFDFQWPCGQTMMGNIKEMVKFWANHEDTLLDFDGDYVKAYLKDLCKKCLCLHVQYTFSYVKSSFNHMEGYCRIDGTEGIKLISICDMDLDNADDFNFTQI